MATFPDLPINVVTIKWGTKYSASDVNRLYKHIKAHTSLPISFYCFTDNTQHLLPEIITHSLPNIKILPEHKNYAYLKEAGLCENNLGGLNGKRVFFFDLDVAICGNLDQLFQFPKNNEFVTTFDWKDGDPTIGQASMYSWLVGTLGYIKNDYESRPFEIIKQFHTASQEYLAHMVQQKFAPLKFWPLEWIISFKYHCLPKWWQRYFSDPKLPSKAKVIAFHGDPKPDNALIGQWSDSKLPWHKKIYKKNRPATWLKDLLD